jgi:hypothetical protein
MSTVFKNLRGIVITGLFFLGVVFMQTNALAGQAIQAQDLSGEDTQVKSVNPDEVCMANDRGKHIMVAARAVPRFYRTTVPRVLQKTL